MWPDFWEIYEAAFNAAELAFPLDLFFRRERVSVARRFSFNSLFFSFLENLCSGKAERARMHI